MVESKSQVDSFCLELSKKLNMRYKSPPLPVDLAIVGIGKDMDNESSVAKFEALAAGDSSGIRDVAAFFDKK